MDPKRHTQVAAAGAKPGWSQSSVVEAALRYFFSSAIEHERDALLIKRLDETNRRLARIERDQQSHLERSDVGVHFQLIMGPRLVGESFRAAVAEARPMFDTYRRTLENRLSQGRKLLGEALADAVFSKDDFLQRASQVSRDTV